MKLKIIILGLLSAVVLHAVNVGEVLPEVTLQNNNGGDANDKPWSSKSLKGKVHVVLYMDPDERKKAMPFVDTLSGKNFDNNRYTTVAIINLAATWMPDIMLEKLMSKKQKEMKNTTFVFDKTKHLLKAWGLKDDASNIIVVDKNMKVLYKKSGKLSSVDMAKIMDIISKNIK